MDKFKETFSYADEKELIKKDYAEAGIGEVYQIGDWRHLGNFHTDFIGKYIGDDLSVIPDNAEVRYSVMDAEEYGNTLLANCSGNAADFVCEETGKVLIVQFYVPQD